MDGHRAAERFAPAGEKRWRRAPIHGFAFAPQCAPVHNLKNYATDGSIEDLK
jgi:hypothetical protein